MATREDTISSVQHLYRRQVAERRRLIRELTPTSPFEPVFNSILVPEVLIISDNNRTMPRLSAKIRRHRGIFLNAPQKRGQYGEEGEGEFAG